MKVPTYWGAAIAALALVGVAGCELPCLADCEENETPAPDTDPPSTAFQSYHYVLIRDLEDSAPNPHGTDGADIDGVELRHGGSANFADYVDFIEFGEGETDFQDANEVLGPPEGDCDPQSGTFVSLGGSGGPGGALIVSFELASGELQEIVSGDAVAVHECGTLMGVYSVWVGVSADVGDPNWVMCGSYMTGVATCVIDDLPQIPVQ